MFAIEWSKRSVKELKKLDSAIAKRIILKVNSLKEDPFRYPEHFEGESCYKLRIGEYRALIDVGYEPLKITVRVVGNRKNIYKKK